MSIHDPLGKFNGNELDYVSSYLDSEGETCSIPWVQRFEEAVCVKLGVKYAVACNSGTSALHMSMVACGVGPGDEVIVPALTVVMDPYVVMHCGATPVFADVDLDTYLIDISDIERKINSKTKAIITVSLQGLSVDMEPILELAKKHGLLVVDDSAQNLYGTYKGRLAGTLADVNVLSFENKKHMTSGSEGGMLLTNSERLAKRARKFGGIGYKHMTASAGRTSLALADVQNPDYERFDFLGLNYRMPEVCAAVGLAQFERAGDLVARRRAVASLFDEAVSECPWMIPQHVPLGIKHSHYTYSVVYQGYEKLDITWQQFYKLYTELGGDGFYSACVVPYLEPVFTKNEELTKQYPRGTCPNAETLQKQIMQFKTNYRSLAEAADKANILRELIAKLGA